MKHLPMDPDSPEAVADALQVDDKAKVWTLTRGEDGKLEEELDLELLLKLNPNHSLEQIADALVLAAAAVDIEETRVW